MMIMMMLLAIKFKIRFNETKIEFMVYIYNT